MRRRSNRMLRASRAAAAKKRASAAYGFFAGAGAGAGVAGLGAATAGFEAEGAGLPATVLSYKSTTSLVISIESEMYSTGVFGSLTLNTIAQPLSFAYLSMTGLNFSVRLSRTLRCAFSASAL